MNTAFQAEFRPLTNKTGLRQLRRSGRLPGIVFGKHTDNKMIHLSVLQVQKWLRQGSSGIVELHFEDGTKLPALLEDLQRDPLTREPIHIDFQQVQSEQPVKTRVPVEFKGTPAGTKQGGVVQIQSASIEIEALPAHVPSLVQFDISELGVGAAVHVKDVSFPAEVTVLSDANEFLLTVVKP